jgi:charged multivesicular body protein 2A
MSYCTQALKSMNKQMSLPGLQKVMAEFMKENERSEMVMETLGDTMDEAFEVEGEQEDEEMIVNQILDEMGISE